MVGVTLRFLIEQVGEVEGMYASEGRLAENFILQRTASHSIELLGILTFRASPVWVLAALADVTGGGQRLLREIAGALKEEGLLEGDGRFETKNGSRRPGRETSSSIFWTACWPTRSCI